MTRFLKIISSFLIPEHDLNRLIRKPVNHLWLEMDSLSSVSTSVFLSTDRRH